MPASLCTAYPKIVAGKEHPVLQESNCPEMKLVLETAKQTRDAIVHASPMPSVEAFERMSVTPGLTTDTGKQAMVMNLQFSHVEALVDSAVGLVRKIEVSVRGNADRVGWLVSRPKSGPFPPEVFS
jgi:hypothetical protein